MESSQHAVAKADEALLAELGYKQEFKRAFTPLEVLSALLLVTRMLMPMQPQVFGIAFSIIGLLPSIAYLDLSLVDYIVSNEFYIVPCCFMPCLMADQLQWCGVYVFVLIASCVNYANG